MEVAKVVKSVLSFSNNKKDGDPYVWLNELSYLSPSIHIKQKTKDIYSHKPFTKKYNNS